MTLVRLVRQTAVVMALVASVVASSAETTRDIPSGFVYDGETTYCWGTRANVSYSDVTDDMIFVRGSKAECPLQLHVQVATVAPLFVGQSLAFTWTVITTPNTDSAIFPVEDTPALVDRRTRQRATIIHSNIHTCHVGSGCDAFRQGETDTNATLSQVGNVSALPLTFSTNDVVFSTPGTHIVLAHLILPGPTLDTRYDFAVFTTIDVVVAASDTSVQSNGGGAQTLPNPENQNATTKSSPAHVMSKNQVIILSVVGAALLVLLLVVTVYARRNDRSLLGCTRKRDDSGLRTTKGSNYGVHGSNLRTRSSDWTELYAIDDMLPVSLRAGEDPNAIAILRDSSRNSTPCSTPLTHDRTVADFRHDVARWDERSSASPITPSSSAILIAAIQDPEALARTPSNDCFVPLELLVASSPPAVCCRAPSPPPSPPPRPRWKAPFRSSGRKRRQQQAKHEPPEDSGDEQEVDM